MKHAAEEVKVKEGTADIAVSFDGSWQKQGHSSLNGILSAISVSTGKVLDYGVKSNNVEAVMHTMIWTKNHSGSSGQMEGAGFLDIYKRSEQRYGLRYV